MLANGYILNFHTLVFNWLYTTIKYNINASEDNKFIGENACSAVCGSSGIGHCLTIVGYNDSIWIDINDNNVVDAGELGAFKIANSWGTNWGNKGYMWFAYDALKQYSTIPGAPSANRLTGWRDNNEVYWLLPSKNDYKPVLLSEITLHCKSSAKSLPVKV
jgi:C1A family cysteine protease